MNIEIHYNGLMDIICDKCDYPIDKYDDSSDDPNIVICPVCHTKYDTPEGFK